MTRIAEALIIAGVERAHRVASTVARTDIYQIRVEPTTFDTEEGLDYFGYQEPSVRFYFHNPDTDFPPSLELSTLLCEHSMESVLREHMQDWESRQDHQAQRERREDPRWPFSHT